MSAANYLEEWRKNGYFVVPRLFDVARVEKMRAICDDILRQWRAASPNPAKDLNNINMAYLTEPRYFRRQPQHLRILLETIADVNTLSIFEQVFGVEPLFHNTQYFFDPANDTGAGDWHRDQQFGAPNIEAEQAAMSLAGFHVHVAFVPDDNLEIVPGTHERWDTPEEFEVRKGLNGKRPNDDMPGAVRINLEAGDACFFSAWCLHRGNYFAGKLRRTFDVIYGAEPTKIHVPPPTCFQEPGALDGVRPQVREFFERFIGAYKGKWEGGEYEY